MTEASLFYQAISTGLGNDFLDDVQRVVERLRDIPISDRRSLLT